MEILFSRDKSEKCLEFLVDKIGNLYISNISLHICNYFLEKEKKDILANKIFFDQFGLIDFDSTIIATAYNIYTKDFEDALQVASCLEIDCDQLWTLDKKMQNNYGNVCNILML